MQYRNSKRNEYIYNFKNYKGNYLTPFLETKTVIVVYVHGFLGDNNTFHEFPNLLKDSLKLYNVRIINKVIYINKWIIIIILLCAYIYLFYLKNKDNIFFLNFKL